jgi:hypothetical protein
MTAETTLTERRYNEWPAFELALFRRANYSGAVFL